jgi:ribonuclease E
VAQPAQKPSGGLTKASSTEPGLGRFFGALKKMFAGEEVQPEQPKKSTKEEKQERPQDRRKRQNNRRDRNDNDRNERRDNRSDNNEGREPREDNRRNRRETMRKCGKIVKFASRRVMMEKASWRDETAAASCRAQPSSQR